MPVTPAPDPRLAAVTFYDSSAPWGVNPVTGRPWGAPEQQYPYVCGECKVVIEQDSDHAVTCSWWDTPTEVIDALPF